ncbi:hypothetical protein BD413DRAFT_577754 [Trametes elegans]|nr:hypothetical protein BD413DRAFT_577754 [Trametes elegans]
MQAQHELDETLTPAGAVRDHCRVRPHTPAPCASRATHDRPRCGPCACHGTSLCESARVQESRSEHGVPLFEFTLAFDRLFPWHDLAGARELVAQSLGSRRNPELQLLLTALQTSCVQRHLDASASSCLLTESEGVRMVSRATGLPVALPMEPTPPAETEVEDEPDGPQTGHISSYAQSRLYDQIRGSFILV